MRFILIINVLIFCGVLKVHSQSHNDTLNFYSHFNFQIKYIEVIDTCNGNSITITPKDGKYRTPKEIILNEKSKVFKIIVKPRFSFRKFVSFIIISDIELKYVDIWMRKGIIKYNFHDRVKPFI